LVYPAKVSFGEAATPTEASVPIKLNLPGLNANSQVAALTRGPLTRLEGKKSNSTGEYLLPSALGKDSFLAVKTGDKIVAGWPAASDPKLEARVRSAMPDSEDFFDDRKLFGVLTDTEHAEIYSLILAARKGATTLEEKRSQPWRLEIYRWKQDEDGRRLMLAGKGYLFRGIGAKDELVPTVELSPELWNAGRKR
jgi:hypothetical protein